MFTGFAKLKKLEECLSIVVFDIGLMFKNISIHPFPRFEQMFREATYANSDLFVFRCLEARYGQANSYGQREEAKKISLSTTDRPTN